MNTNVYAPSDDLVNDMGTNTNIVICSEIIFDLETAPGNGCMTVSVGEIDMPVAEFHPNPVIDELRITFTDGPMQADVQIFDLQGKLWITDQIINDQKIDLSGLPAGIYTVTLSTPKGRIVQKIQKGTL